MADALLRAFPGLRIMATSLHVLGVCGEVTIAVPPPPGSGGSSWVASRMRRIAPSR